MSEVFVVDLIHRLRADGIPAIKGNGPQQWEQFLWATRGSPEVIEHRIRFFYREMVTNPLFFVPPQPPPRRIFIHSTAPNAITAQFYM